MNTKCLGVWWTTSSSQLGVLGDGRITVKGQTRTMTLPEIHENEDRLENDDWSVAFILDYKSPASIGF